MLDYERCLFLDAPKCSLGHSLLTSLHRTRCVPSLTERRRDYCVLLFTPEPLYVSPPLT